MHTALSHRSILFPVAAESPQVMTDLKILCGLKQRGGAIDGTFLKIQRPPGEYGFRFWCCKEFDVILVLSTVDARGVFDLYACWVAWLCG